MFMPARLEQSLSLTSKQGQNRSKTMSFAHHRRVSPRRFAMLRAVFALILREMATTHGKALGGYLWKILEPVLGIALFSYVASLAFRAPALGSNFPIYFAAGVLPFATFIDVQRRCAGAITFSRQLLGYPSVTFVDAILARMILAFVTQIVVFYFITLGIELWFVTETSYRFERIVAAMVMAGALGAGVGIANCFFWHYFPVWNRIYRILTRPLMLLSGVLFIYEDVPETYQAVIWWNPLVHVTGYSRSGFFGTYNPDWVSFIYVYAFALIPAVVGLFLLYHFHRRILMLN
jgi:capsular polysaccharide transport system permease protein